MIHGAPDAAYNAEVHVTRIATALSLPLVLACAAPADVDAGRDAPMGDAARDAGPPPVVVPEETADARALEALAGFDALPVLGDAVVVQPSSEDRLGGGAMPLLLENGNRDMNHFVCLGEQADVREPFLVEARYDLASCPEPYVRGAVIARASGSGALVRLWMTLSSIRDAPPDRERLLVYVDGEETPRIDVPLGAALDGSASPIFAPPFGVGARTHLAWSYPVVFGSRLIVALDGLGPLDLVYHQATVALDRAPSARAAAARALPERELARASLLAELAAGARESASITLAPDDTLEALALSGPGTIRELSVRAADLAALEAITLRARWDGGEPAIELPLLELFAAALDAPEPAGAILGASREAGAITLALRLPMPFEASASLELESADAAAVTLELAARVEPGVPAAPFGRLHALRSETIGPTSDPAHPLGSVTGPGRLAGVCLMMEGHPLEGAGALASPLNFLEGDERFVVDGEAEIRGTGTEDYLNGAFYFEEGPYATPFAQAWGARVEGTSGRASGCRWHVRTQAIDFSSSLEAELEIGPGVPAVLDRYRSVVFVYR